MSFFAVLDEIKSDIESIDVNNLSKEKFNKTSLMIKQKIINLKKSIHDIKNKEMCETSLNFVVKLFENKILEFKKLENELTQKKLKQNERIILTMSPSITEENLKIAIKNPTEYARLKILSPDDDNFIVNKLKNTEEKYQDVLELESNVNILSEMIMDLALIVDKQGDVLDKIESNVKFADEYISDGNNNMISAIKEQKKYRRRQFCLCCTCTMVIAIIVIVIYFSVFYT